MYLPAITSNTVTVACMSFATITAAWAIPTVAYPSSPTNPAVLRPSPPQKLFPDQQLHLRVYILWLHVLHSHTQLFQDQQLHCTTLRQVVACRAFVSCKKYVQIESPRCQTEWAERTRIKRATIYWLKIIIQLSRQVLQVPSSGDLTKSKWQTILDERKSYILQKAIA